MELLVELLVTAFMAIVFSFFVAKLVSLALPSTNADHSNSNEDPSFQNIENDDHIKGGSVGEFEESFVNLEEKIAKEQIIVDEKDEEKGVYEEKDVGLISGDAVMDHQNGLNGVLEELVNVNEGDSVNIGLEKLNLNEENDVKEVLDLRKLVEEKEGSMGNVVFGEKNEIEEVLDDKIEGFVGVNEEKKMAVETGDFDDEDQKIENEEVGVETIGEMDSNEGKKGVVEIGDFDVEDQKIENEGVGDETIGEVDSVERKKGVGELVSDEDDEDDWEGIERSDLDKVFAMAVKFVDCGGKNDRLLNVGSDVQMQLYGLHKVATEGPCYEAQPMALKVSARAKWNAWQKLGSMSPEVAMEQYVSLLSVVDPGWTQALYPADDKANSSRIAQSGVSMTTSSNKDINSTFSKDKRDLIGDANSSLVD